MLLVSLSLFLVTGVVLLSAQQTAPKSIPQYENSAAALDSFIHDLLDAVNYDDENPDKLNALIRETEIPNFRIWFRNMYELGSAESWLLPYGRNLFQREADFRKTIVELSKGNVDISVTKVNDNPNPQGMELGMLHSTKKPLDIYVVKWTSKDPGATPQPLGYFYYIDGGFRWDSNLKFFPAQSIGRSQAPVGGVYRPGGGVSMPKPTYRPSPDYSEEAARKKINGVVVLTIVVAADGTVQDAHVAKSLGYGLDEKAVETIKTWRFEPGRKDGVPVPVQLSIEVSFHYAKN